jgi:hypothetical protein
VLVFWKATVFTVYYILRQNLAFLEIQR